jgi:hypothetical protein
MPVKRPYLPPFAVILSLLGLSKAQLPVADDQPVTLPFGVLRLLLRGALAAVPFHEERYMRLNPDVASAVFRGEIKSGREHFVTNGYFEGREGVGDEFAEAWYLDSNADVAMAVSAGTFASARDHYNMSGMFELRGPNPGADGDLASWRACCLWPPAQPAAAEHGPVDATQDH